MALHLPTHGAWHNGQCLQVFGSFQNLRILFYPYGFGGYLRFLPIASILVAMQDTQS